MKKILFILFLTIPILFTSCTSNDDPIVDDVTDPELPFTLNNILGTWEVYYLEKSINGTGVNEQFKERAIDYDGFTTTYSYDGKDSLFVDKNPFGETIFSGKFSIKNGNKIQFTFKKTPNSVSDTITSINVSSVKGKYLYIYTTAKVTVTSNKKEYTVTDRKFMRRQGVKDIPGAIDKIVTIPDYSKLLGKWNFTNYQYSLTLNGNVVDYKSDSALMADKKKAYAGLSYTFNPDKTILIHDPSGTNVRGRVVVVDDVVYIKADAAAVVDQENRQDGDDGFYIWIKNPFSDVNFNDSGQSRSAGTDLNKIARRSVLFSKDTTYKP